MKIIHASGEAYDLPADAVLEMERTNPFFNAYGERSLPLMLPPSDKNRRLMDYADDMTGIRKPSQRIDASIHAGIFFYPASMSSSPATKSRASRALFT